MTGGNKCIGSPVFFFFKIGTTQLIDASQIVNLDELVRVAKAYQLKVSPDFVNASPKLEIVCCWSEKRLDGKVLLR